jgi:hypothetical protein
MASALDDIFLMLRVGHNLPCGNAAAIRGEDQSSLLSEPTDDNKHSSQGRAYWISL